MHRSAEGCIAAGAPAAEPPPLHDPSKPTRTRCLQAGCSAHLAATAAAAACAADEDPAAAAQAAFDAAFAEAKEAAVKQKRGGTEAGAGGAKLAGAGGPAASVLRQRGGKQGGSGPSSGAQAAAGDEAAGRALEEEEERRQADGEDANVPEWMRGEFSWKVGRMVVAGAAGLRICWMGPSGCDRRIYRASATLRRMIQLRGCAGALPRRTQRRVTPAPARSPPAAESVGGGVAPDPAGAAHAGPVPAGGLGGARPGAVGPLTKCGGSGSGSGDQEIELTIWRAAPPGILVQDIELGRGKL